MGDPSPTQQDDASGAASAQPDLPVEEAIPALDVDLNEDIDDEVQAEEPAFLGKVARILEGKLKHIYGSVSTMAKEVGKSQRHVVRALHALAEAAAREQSAVQEGVLSYANLRRHSGLRRCVFLQHIQHDETQVRLVASHPGGQPHEHRGRLHVVQHSWSCLLEDAEHASYFLVSGEFSPALRLSENATGETIAEVLNSTTGPQSPLADIIAGFERHCTVVESDECPANNRALKMIRTEDEPCFHGHCAAHKVHAVANKSWLQHQDLHTGLVKTLKVLKSPGVLPRFLEKLLGILDEAEILIRQPITEEALAHWKLVLRAFSPSLSQKPKSASVIRVLAFYLFNGDWRAPRVQHRCQGDTCCRSPEDSSAR